MCYSSENECCLSLNPHQKAQVDNLYVKINIWQCHEKTAHIKIIKIDIDLSLTLCNYFSTSLWVSSSYILGSFLSTSEGFHNDSSAEDDGSAGATSQLCSLCLASRKAGASVFTEGKHERKTVLVLEEGGMEEEEREWKREMRRKREWNFFHCIAIHSRFHPMSLIYSFNKNTFVLHFGFTISEIIMFYSWIFNRYAYFLTKSR